MKKKTILSLLLCWLLGAAATAWPLPYTIDHGAIAVGDQDKVLGSTDLKNSADTSESDWVKSVLGLTAITLDDKYDSFAADWKKTDSGNLWAYNLRDNPDYFLIKTGNNQTNALETYLFQNNADLDWAVISLGDVFITDVKGVSKISHIDEFADPTPVPPAPVPEPGTMMLLGAGFLGLAIYLKRRKNV